MTTRILVRKMREGRQITKDRMHLIEKGEERTICDEIHVEDLREVRDVSVFEGNTPVCEECNRYFTTVK